MNTGSIKNDYGGGIMSVITSAHRIGKTSKVLLTLSNIDKYNISKDKEIKGLFANNLKIDSIPMVRYEESEILHDFMLGIEMPLDVKITDFIGKEIELV